MTHYSPNFSLTTRSSWNASEGYLSALTMLYLTFILFTALLLGMRHATDADHVLAVSTIVSRERSLWRATGVGVLWGVGHTATILLVGGAIVVFGLVVPPRLDSAFEACVALMLILLGIRNLMDLHTHAKLPSLPPFVVGVVHGLAGSAAAALLIVPLIHDPTWAVLYLVTFGLGTIAGMTMLTWAIATSTLYVSNRLTGLNRWIRVGAGAMSCSFGMFMLYRIA